MLERIAESLGGLGFALTRDRDDDRLGEGDNPLEHYWLSVDIVLTPGTKHDRHRAKTASNFSDVLVQAKHAVTEATAPA